MNGFWNQLVFDNPVKKYFFVFIAIDRRLAFQANFFKVCRRAVVQGSDYTGQGD